MTTVEQRELDGGWIGLALAIASAVIYIYNNAGDFVAGGNEYFATHQK